MRAAAVRPGRATADFSKRTIVAGPHVWLVGGPAIDESSVGIRSPDRALRRNRRWRWLGPMLPPWHPAQEARAPVHAPSQADIES